MGADIFSIEPETPYPTNHDTEVKTTEFVKGRPKIEWVKKSGVRNEPLDCRVYATAAMELFNPDFEYLEKTKYSKHLNKRKKGVISRGVNYE